MNIHTLPHTLSCAIFWSRVLCDKHDRFHKFQDLVALRQHVEGLGAYMDKFMELYAQVPDMSPLTSLAIYFGALEASVRIHLLGAQHVSTLERALEETRIYANAHRGFWGTCVRPV